MATVGLPVKTTASAAWDVIKGEAAGAASLILQEQAAKLSTYADKAVASGASSLKAQVSSSPAARSLALDLGLGGNAGLMIAAVVVLVLILR